VVCGRIEALWPGAIIVSRSSKMDFTSRLRQVWLMCSWTLGYSMRLRLWVLAPSVRHLFHDFHCSPILSRRPYEGRLPQTSWWSKLSNMTVGQSSLILNPLL